MSNLCRSLTRSASKTQNVQQFARYYSAPTSSDIPEAKLKYIPSSGTYPKGFRVSGTHVGVKASNKSKPDLAFIASDVPCNAAAVFTTNKFKAAPVQVSKSILENQQGSGVRSVIINSGCANAVTGTGGMEDAFSMSAAATSCVEDVKEPRSLVMSTGVIGQRLPIQKIIDGIPVGYAGLDDSHDAWLSTAKAICTTDTFPKLISTTFTLPGPNHRGATYSLAGMTKGAGMIHPNMATLLGVLCTDAPISPSALQTLLTAAINQSFNSISIDGDTSTNDTVAILANGAAAAQRSKLSESNVITSTDSEDYKAMSQVLTKFTQKLSQLVVRDGEGATKFICVTVRNAPTYKDAHAIASTIAKSPLVKTALYGKDANWGRILCAVGYTDIAKLSSPDVVIPEKTSVSFVPAETSNSKDEGVLKLLVDGEPQNVDESRAARLLEDEDLEIDVNLGNGNETAKYWFCDFSHEYVTINGDYRT